MFEPNLMTVKKSDFFEIKLYSSADKADWDRFVDASKNGTFLFRRDYMDYHADRFSDFSVMVFRKGKLYALLPANRRGATVVSHGGLTYGGLLLDSGARAEEVLRLFDCLMRFFAAGGVDELVYKPVPYIYASLPSDEDLYALFRCNARLSARNVSAVVDFANPLPWSTMRRRALRKSEKAGVEATFSDDFERFWALLSANLDARYGAVPVHTLDEILRLRRLFADNIRLVCSYDARDEMLAGAVLYVTDNVVHTQYLSASPRGREVGGLDAAIALAMDKYRDRVRYFDFGTSNERDGLYLNESLIYHKEGFGARAVCYDTYTVNINL